MFNEFHKYSYSIQLSLHKSLSFVITQRFVHLHKHCTYIICHSCVLFWHLYTSSELFVTNTVFCFGIYTRVPKPLPNALFSFCWLGELIIFIMLCVYKCVYSFITVYFICEITPSHSVSAVLYVWDYIMNNTTPMTNDLY